MGLSCLPISWGCVKYWGQYMAHMPVCRVGEVGSLRVVFKQILAVGIQVPSQKVIGDTLM